ncbi:polyhydroxyalkanoate depolymerase [Zavarzinia sp. CC-PAN008]|uniref:polyhydroxyalkanoate depolymerase n=1 Tax=Zavarzinia sp. CC-PAN008 TaxID=3243332 RepID=UPI003F7452E5
MLYSTYQTTNDLFEPARALARVTKGILALWPDAVDYAPVRQWSAAWEMVSRAQLTHHRPPYDIDHVTVGNREVAVVEEAAMVTPFGTLLRFAKPQVDVVQPRVLVIAPLSGHFATLLRNTVQTLAADHDVYITDWHNARDIPLSAGRFGFEDYITHVIQFLEALGPGAHVVAVCQPCVQALAAVAVMSQRKNPATPRSMTLMAGPIDTRINPTKVNDLAMENPIEWFEEKLISTVPARFAGAGRRVYPGFMQLTAFMSMNMKRHREAHRNLYRHLARGELPEAEKIKTFYDEYFAVLDLTAEFYIETVKIVFQDAALAKGEAMYQGERIDPSKIRRTALLTVEGERDDICALGQTAAAHDLCTGLRPYMKRHHMQAGVGHYGVFSGKKWEREIYPIVRNLMLSHD